MKLSSIVRGIIEEGLASSVFIRTKSKRENALAIPAELLGTSAANLCDLLDYYIQHYDLSEYTPNSFWDKLGIASPKIRKCFDKAKQIRPGKLRYLQTYRDYFMEYVETFKKENNISEDRYNAVVQNIMSNISFLDTFFFVLGSYRPYFEGRRKLRKHFI